MLRNLSARVRHLNYGYEHVRRHGARSVTTGRIPNPVDRYRRHPDALEALQWSDISTLRLDRISLFCY